ncbi:uncharacterized protein LOC128430617 [Pleuronectes platessa]|uniref:uncharacterized protein LOC128430617 n=1 Tax=Pleuronectes platessa TaxID=8262 RepID=UPI00232A2203|nr:uncharacterized protein LOC128430617 [Pleuronectes platessa]
MWLVANDVGYLKYLLDRHIAESQDPGRTGGTRENDWVKDCLLRYVEFFPSVSCHLEKNVDRAIYGQGRFKSFTFQEMWQWYSLHKCLNADPQAGSAQERKMAEEAFSSVRQWLGMKEEDISSKSLKRFRRFILDKEKQKAPTAAVPSSSLSGPVPSETVVPPSASVVPPSASASASVAPPTATSLSPWQDDTLLSEALATFEGQADTAMAPPPDPPQQPQTDPVPPSQEPPSGPRKRTSKSAALPQPQPIEATVTQPEVIHVQYS